MAVFKMRATLRGVKPSVTRTFVAPADISFLDLHLILQAMAGWGGRNTHRFRIGERKIGPKAFEVTEEADEMVESYLGSSKIIYEYGSFTVDLMFLKGKVTEEFFPRIIDSTEEFPPEECRDLDEYLDVLRIMDDPADPSHADIIAWMESVKASQDIEEINREFIDKWERIGQIEGRIPFNVGATIGALLLTGSEGFFYDTEKQRLTEESDGSARYLPIEPSEDEFVKTLAGLYADSIGLKSDNLLEVLLEDEHRAGWEEYAENFLDDITDRWADRYGYIIECYADCDIARMMDVFDEKPEE